MSLLGGVAILTKLPVRDEGRTDLTAGDHFSLPQLSLERPEKAVACPLEETLSALLPSAAAFQLVQEINSVFSSVLLPFMT